MPLLINGAITGTSADVDTTRRALHVSLQPVEVGANGSYRCAQTSGTIAAGLTTASHVYAFQWAPSPNTMFALVKHVRVSMGDLVGFTAGFAAFNLFVARAFSVQAATGGTAATLTTNNCKLRTSFATTAGASTYISTTAAISGQTATLDAMPISTVSNSVIATAGQPLVTNTQDLWRPQVGEMPLILANQEGFIINATVPATGTWQLGVEVAWDEVATF